jgi:hypothetical protein
MIKFLLWVGFVARNSDGGIDWPFHTPPAWLWQYHLHHNWKPYLFRNLPGVIKWKKGRLLPRRWGGGWLGFEFGDRGH